MITSGLSLNQAPPFGVPFGYFIVSTIFAIVASLAILYFGIDVLSNRYAPETLALVHLFTLGVMGFAMIGTLFQMLPVIAGVVLPKPKLLGSVVFLLLLIGATLLPLGFFISKPLFFMISATALLLAFALFAVFAIYALVKLEYKNVTTKLMLASLVALMVAVLLGAHLATSRALGKLSESTIIFADLHASWAMIGWVGLLALGVAQQVLPMFYVAPRYPKFCRTVTGPLLFGSLVALIPLHFLGWAVVAKLGVATGIAMFSSMTISRSIRRKRKVADGSLRYWQFAMVIIFLSIPIMFLNYDFAPSLLAVLYGGGFLALINAMIYKVVPFLGWFHLSTLHQPNTPLMHNFIGKKRAYLQLYFFASGIFMLIAGLFVPYIAQIGGGLLLVSYTILFIDLIGVAKLFKANGGSFLPR